MKRSMQAMVLRWVLGGGLIAASLSCAGCDWWHKPPEVIYSPALDPVPMKAGVSYVPIYDGFFITAEMMHQMIEAAK